MTRTALWLCLALAACAQAPLLHGDDLADKVKVGMTGDEVTKTLGVESARKETHGNGTTSWSYKYRDTANIHKLLHVTFKEGRVAYTSTEWDPDVYSKGGAGRDR